MIIKYINTYTFVPAENKFEHLLFQQRYWAHHYPHVISLHILICNIGWHYCYNHHRTSASNFTLIIYDPIWLQEPPDVELICAASFLALLSIFSNRSVMWLFKLGCPFLVFFPNSFWRLFLRSADAALASSICFALASLS